MSTTETLTPAQAVETARQELEAMEAVLAAVEFLPECSARRVLEWASNVTEDPFATIHGQRTR